MRFAFWLRRSDFNPDQEGTCFKPIPSELSTISVPGNDYRDQPLLGYGSGFLVAQDVIATAGHCVEGFNISGICTFFDFEMRNHKIELTRQPSEVYYAVEALKVVIDPDGTDYALVQLDRPVSGVMPLAIIAGDVTLGTPVYVIGHPVGLPKKVAFGAKVLDNSPGTYFLTNLDTFAGNSGSPVLTEDHLVCGILVGGAPDFVKKGDCVVATTFPLNESGEAVCRASIWRDSISKDKLSRLIEASGGGQYSAQRDPIGRTYRVALEEFLRSAFSIDELRRLVRYNLVLETIGDDVKWDASLTVVAAQIVEALEERSLLEHDFFEILKAERPRRVAEVESLRVACSKNSAATAPNAETALPKP